MSTPCSQRCTYDDEEWCEKDLNPESKFACHHPCLRVKHVQGPNVGVMSDYFQLVIRFSFLLWPFCNVCKALEGFGMCSADWSLYISKQKNLIWIAHGSSEDIQALCQSAKQKCSLTLIIYEEFQRNPLSEYRITLTQVTWYGVALFYMNKSVSFFTQ